MHFLRLGLEEALALQVSLDHSSDACVDPSPPSWAAMRFYLACSLARRKDSAHRCRKCENASEISVALVVSSMFEFSSVFV